MFGPGIYFIMNIGFKNVSLKRSTTSFEATHISVYDPVLRRYVKNIHKIKIKKSLVLNTNIKTTNKCVTHALG